MVYSALPIDWARYRIES